jgi:hypothetical protein
MKTLEMRVITRIEEYLKELNLTENKGKEFTVNVNPEIAEELRLYLNIPKYKSLVFLGAKIRKKNTLKKDQVEII